jgi:type II pantothenate kinase
MLSNMEIQKYWLDLLEKNLSDFLSLSISFGISKQKLDSFKSLYLGHIHSLRNEPDAYGQLTIRKLLDLREQCLKEVGIYDVFETIKKKEVENALKELPKVLDSMIGMPEDERLQNLFDNILAGNMYDWG